MHVHTREVNTSQEVLNLLQKKQIDFAIVQGDIAYEAANTSMPNLRAITSLYPKMLAFIIKKDCNISSFKELKEKNISFSFSSYDTQHTCHKIFQTFDINASHPVQTLAQITQDMKTDKIDGFFSLLGHPNQATDALIHEHNLTLIPLFGKKFDQLKNDNSFFIKGGMPKGVYGLKEDVKSIGVKALLVTTKEMNETTVYNITKMILENMDTFKKENPIYRGISKKGLLNKIPISQHKGATKAFNAL